MTKRHLILVGFIVLVVTAVGVGFAAAQSLLFSSDPSSQVRELERANLGVEVAQFPPQSGRPDASVYVALLADGSVCVNAAISDKTSWSGGCNPASAPLGDKPFMALFTYDGGPTVATVKEARLHGLVDHSVKNLRAEMSDSSTRQLSLSAHPVVGTPYRVFAHRVSPADLNTGITPVAVVAYDASGGEISRQPTGLTTGVK